METWSLIDGCWQPGDLPGATARWYVLTAADREALEALAARYSLHPLAIEDCLSTSLHTPKVDEFPGHLFTVVLALDGEGAEALHEVDFFLGADFLVTYTDAPLAEFESVRRALTTGRQVRPGTDGLLYEVVDRLVDGILPEINGIAEQLETLENGILAGSPGRADSHRIVELRAHAGQVRRLLGPQLTVMQRLSRGEFSQVSAANRAYFRDVYDHMVHVDLSLESVREDAEVVLSTYLSALNNRMNEVMKVLSVVAALALPATVISGIFGTNFDNVPGLHSNWGFVAMIAAMASVAGSMAFYFKRRGWW